jgi:oligosaccharide repeat unit polymerase
MSNQLPSNRPLRDNTQGTFLIAVFAALCALTVLVLQIVGGKNSSVSLALLTILLSGFIAVWRFRRYGLDPLGMFSAAFLMYDGVLLLRLSLVSNSSVLLYPTTFGDDSYAAAGTLCVLATTTVLLTMLVWEGIAGKDSATKFSTPSEASALSWFWVGVSCYLLGLALYYLQFRQFGGYLASLTMQRGDRFELANDGSSLSYPFMSFVVSGIACMCYGSLTSTNRLRRAAFYGFTAIWCLLVLLQGDRRLVLQAMLAVAGVMAVVRPHVLRLRARTWILIATAYCLFVVFGYARTFIYTIATGTTSASTVVTDVNEQMSSDSLAPENTEFAGPYLSLLVSVSSHSENLYGASYYESFFTVLPRFMYPGQKPELLTHQFDRQMHAGGGTVAGWGFNPVAEAYVNFGTVGVVIVFALWTLYFLLLKSIRLWGPWGVLLSAVLLSEAVNANRIDFRNVYWETTYFVVCITGLSIVHQTVSRISKRTPGLRSKRTPFAAMALRPPVQTVVSS